MGTSNSRRMDDHDSRSRSDDSSDPESDLTSILHYLIESGQFQIISSDREDSDDEFVAAASPPIRTARPNTKELEKSDLSVSTKQACGLKHKKGFERPQSVIAMVCNRERGRYGNVSFTKGDCCKMNNAYLPNTSYVVGTFETKVFCGNYFNDGNSFLSASQDKKIRLFDTSDGRFDLVKTITARDVGWSILDTALSPDGCFVAFSSWSECLHLCDLNGDLDQQEPLLLCPDERRFCIFSLTFSSDGRELLCGANDGYIYVYDRECNQRALRISGHEDDVNAVAFADDSSHILYSGGDDGFCKVWDRRTLSESNAVPVGYLAGHMDGITYVEARGDGRHLLTNSKDQSIKLWDVRVFSSSQGLDNTVKAVSSQSWDYRWQRVPKALTNPKKKIAGDTSVMTYCGHSVLQTLCRCHFSPQHTTGQRFIYTGCAAGRVVVYDVLTGKIEKELSGHLACVRDASWHPFQNEIVSTSWDGTILLWRHGKSDLDSDSDDDVELLGLEAPVRPAILRTRRSKRLAERRAREQASQKRRHSNLNV